MNNATLRWLRHPQGDGWVLEFRHDDGSAEARRVKGNANASRDELVKEVTEAMGGDYLDGAITVFRNGQPAETINASRGLAS